MRLTFLGHAAFLLETRGKRVIFDPYSSEIGYLPVDADADFVCLSHQNPKWHSCLDAVGGDFEILDGLNLVGASVRRGDLSFGAARVFEKPGEGENAMVWLESEGLRVLHMGDCGVLPDEVTLENCGRVDVLLALAGGFPTLALDDLMVLTEKLAPRMVIPMHFGVPGLQMAALDVAAIEQRFQPPHRVRNAGSSLEITPETLPQSAQLQVLKPLRLKSN